MSTNDEFIMKGLEFANTMKMTYTVICAINGFRLGMLLENIVRSLSIHCTI